VLSNGEKQSEQCSAAERYCPLQCINYEEDEAYTVPATQRKYSETMVIQEAKKLQALPANKEPYQVTKEVTETVTAPDTYTVKKVVISLQLDPFRPLRRE